MRFFRLLIVFLIVVLVLMAVLASQAGRFLIVDKPEKSDVIVVLGGETRVRPAHALELLRSGMASHVFINAESGDVIYDHPLVDLAQRYIDHVPESNQLSVCPIIGLSTNAEADDVSRCLQPLHAHRVMIVTSDFHTRRSLMIFCHRLPQYHFTTAGAPDPAEFGAAWWTRREWAKNTFSEWLKILWWEAVDRWRN